MTLTAVGVDSSSKGRMNDKANITSVQALVKAIPKYTSCNGVDNFIAVTCFADIDRPQQTNSR